MNDDTAVECAIALVWPEGRHHPLCEMFRVDLKTRTWSSKHFSRGTSFTDGGGLHDGETARSLARSGTGSGLYRYPSETPVTFVVASIDETLYFATSPADWTVERLRALRDVEVQVLRAT